MMHTLNTLPANRFRRLSITIFLPLLSLCFSFSAHSQEIDTRNAYVSDMSLCGAAADYQHVERYDGSLGPSANFIEAHQGAVGLIQWNDDLESIYTNPGNVGNTPWCTGTMVSPNLLLTSGHCFTPKKNDNIGWDTPIDDATGAELTPEAAALNMQVNFNYQRDSAGSMRDKTTVKIVALREHKLSGLDFAVVELEGTPGGTFGSTLMDVELPNHGDQLTMIQHPDGMAKMVDAGRYDGLKTKTNSHSHMRYIDLDTSGGSSGAALLNHLGRIVGIHSRAGCTRSGGANHGVLISDIISVSSLLTEAFQYEGTRTMSISGGGSGQGLPLLAGMEQPQDLGSEPQDTDSSDSSDGSDSSDNDNPYWSSDSSSHWQSDSSGYWQ